MSTTGTCGEKPVSICNWILTLVIMSLPLVGLFFLFYWAFGDSTAQSKKNYCRATLILFAIGIVLGLLFLFVFGGLALLAGLRTDAIH
jgi:Kef-type K+ transport system membrane component KefB